jgi:outer membrane protein OmpA-like peptidoglycan-associated protein
VNRANKLIAAAVGAILVTACASAPKTLPEVEQARADVQTLASQPKVETVAATELRDSRMSLQGAETALKEGRKEDALHYAYLASKQAETGEARIKEDRARDEIARGETDRTKVLLEARTRDAQDATEAARAEQARAQAATQEALAAKAAADEARAKNEDMQRQLAELQAKQTDRGMVLTLGDVLFDTGAATLKPGADSVMNRVSEFMTKNTDTKVLIEGHTDSRGSDEYNELLSQRRAAAVRDALAARGVDRSRVEAVGKGEGFPVASNDSPAGRQQNRRVEIVFSDQQGRFAGGANASLR